MKPTPANHNLRHHSGACDYCGLPLSSPVSDGEPAYCCFGCRFADSISRQSSDANLQLSPASALGFSVFFTMNVVMMTMALWSYADQNQSDFERALRNFLRYGAMSFSAPVLLLLGRPLFSHALTALKRSAFTTDLLLSVGVIAAFAVSVFNTIRNSGHVYYEVGCVILVLVTLGRWLEAVGRANVCEALGQLEQLVPDMVRKWTTSGCFKAPRRLVMVGDHIRVLAGERIPLDGRVKYGRGVVDEQFFTGESTPVEKQPGDNLLGGSMNLDGDLVFEVTAPPTGGALGRLIEAVRNARLTKGRYQQLSDTWSKWFFPIISVVAVVALVYHGIHVDWEYGLLTSLAVLLIACPCALALATPLAVWNALSTAAKRGVLFRSGRALESLAATRAIRWDKTGTLTTGTPRVVRLFCENLQEQEKLERIAANMTEQSNHVFSRAIFEFLSRTEPNASLLQVQTVPGRGLRAVTVCGEKALLGSVSWMDDSGLAWGPRLSKLLLDTNGSAGSLTAIGYDGCVQGLFLLEETIRPSASPALRACEHLGLDQAVLTGDRWNRASKLATELSLPVEAELLPENKLTSIRAAHKQFGHVAMVGDGLNDAPALAAADVGIALGCGADVTRESADLCLLTSDLQLVPWTIELSRRAVRTIRANLAWSFGYNSVGVIVAATGNLHPAVAAALMVLSSLMVLGNSLRLSTLAPHEQPCDSQAVPERSADASRAVTGTSEAAS